MFVGPRYTDVSLQQWMALIPPELVKQHLHLDDATIAKLDKRKQIVVASDKPNGAAVVAQPG